MKRKLVVFVGLSGGVDSSVTAARLLDEGYEVVGVFIKVWHPDFLECNWESERRDAMRVAAHLQIPFLTCDAEEAYYQDVAQYFIDAYSTGLTPNPDVLCNQHVKFGAFLDFAKSNGADYVATGHYAQTKKDTAGNYRLLRGDDSNKDQSYFLWTLTQEQLKYILFPLGSDNKSEIRQEAATRKLPTAQKRDSQGICFLGQVDLYDFLQRFIPLTPGEVLNKNGEEIGTHKGSFVYTIGQRHGFNLHKQAEKKPYYVVEIDHKNNRLIVDTTQPKLAIEDSFAINNLHWINEEPDTLTGLTAQVRHRQTPFKVKLREDEKNGLLVFPENAIPLPAAGQSCVLYKDNECLGGGIIQ